MKIIQSCWTCNQPNLLQFKAGWVSPEYNLMSWALSCLQLKRYYSNVLLYADSISASMLIDKLGLPYTNVFCDLDKLNGYHTQLWALPKLHTYAQQETSFLHVDSDVFIWEKFDDKLLRGASQYLSVLVAINEFNLVAAAINDLLMVCKYSAQSK